MNNIIGKVLAVVMTLFLVSYVGYQVYRYAYAPVKTETVLKYVMEDTVYGFGIALRDEIPVEQPSSGVVRYFYDDGVRVVTGTAVAEVHVSQANVKDKLRLEEIEKELSRLTSIQQSKSAVPDVASIATKIEEQVGKFIAVNQSGKLQDAAQIADALQDALNQKAIAVGDVEDFSAKIQRLQSEKSTLEAKLVAETDRILSPAYGYFSSYCDTGSSVSLSMIENLSVSEIEQLALGRYEKNPTYAGKVIEGYTWYYTAVLDAKQAEKLQEGNTTTLLFPAVSSTKIPAEVFRMIADESSGKTAVIFSCSYMSDELSKLRNPSVQIDLGSYTGLKIPYKALRFHEGAQGVYIYKNNAAVFRKVDIIYEDIGFFISKIDQNDTSKVQLYDDVIVEGTDLYDGKLLR